MASNNSKMTYLNVTTKGLNGKLHPVFSSAITTSEVKELRSVVKMISGDYYTYSMRSSQSGGSPHCRICSSTEHSDELQPAPEEDISHILTECVGTKEIRETILPKIEAASRKTKCPIDFQVIKKSPKILTQYLLDCTSLNLNNNMRVNISDEAASDIYREARHFIHAVHLERARILKVLDKKYIL